MAEYLNKTGLAYYHSKIIASVSKTVSNGTVSGGTKVLKGGEYVATIKANDGYYISAVTVTMGGLDITSQVFEGSEGSTEYCTEAQVNALIADALAEYGDGDVVSYG